MLDTGRRNPPSRRRPPDHVALARRLVRTVVATPVPEDSLPAALAKTRLLVHALRLLRFEIAQEDGARDR